VKLVCGCVNLWPVTQKEFFEFFEFFSPTRTNLVTRLRLPNFGSSMHPPVIVLVGLPAQQPPKPLIYEIIYYGAIAQHKSAVANKNMAQFLWSSCIFGLSLQFILWIRNKINLLRCCLLATALGATEAGGKKSFRVPIS